jgi:hypothetical protein
MPADSSQPALRADDLGVRLFNTPPSGFRPKTATPDDLKSFGVLQRPTNDSSPEYRLLWERMYSDGFNTIVPQFKPRIAKTKILAPGSAPSAISEEPKTLSQRIAPSPIQYPNWGGIAIARGQHDAPVVQVSGTWNIPNLAVPSYVADGVKCINSIWIGIDGFSPPQSDILQAGVDLVASRQNGVVSAGIYAWWEWWKGDSFYFDNFPVSPGDVISCTITCAAGGSSGTVNMSNAISGNHISLSVPAPQGTTLIGNCAEWIIERQTPDASTAAYTELSEFGSVFFDGAFAATMTPPNAQQTLLPGSGKQIMMMADDGTTILASPTLLGPNTLRIDRR